MAAVTPGSHAEAGARRTSRGWGSRWGRAAGAAGATTARGPTGVGGGGHRARERVPPATAARRGTEHADRTVFPTIHFSPVRSSGQPSQKPEDAGAPRGPFEGTRLGGGGDKRGEQTWRVVWGITRHTDLLQDLSGGAHPAAPSTTVYTSNPARMGV